MVGAFELTASQLKAKEQKLNQDNEKFKKKISELETYANSLKNMWEGEAANKFQQNFTKDREKMNKLYAAVKKYIEHIEKVIKEYQAAEKKNLAQLK